jgi:tetratricopeptide (TPR) repeat protein
VYASVEELNAWLLPVVRVEEIPAQAQTPTPISILTPEPVVAMDAPGVATASPPAAHPTAVASEGAGPHRRPWIVAIAAAALLLVGLSVAWALRVGYARRAAEEGRVASHGASNAPRYVSKVSGVEELYLRGVYFDEQRTPESLNLALHCFLDALDKDPGDAPAWAGLAQTYNLLREYSMMPSAEAYPKARFAAQRALALDPKLPDAHAALGFVEFFWYWKPVDAEQEFRTAIALDPNAALPHHWYGSMLTHQTRYAEALEQLNIAQRLQPSSTAILASRAFALGLSGRRDEAVSLLAQVSQEDPNATAVHHRLAALTAIEPRNMPLRLEQLRLLHLALHDDAGVKEADAARRVYRASGERAMWQALLLQERQSHHGRPTQYIAEIQAELGQKDAALVTLEQLLAEHDPSMIGIALDPMLATLHGDPRFERMVAAVGLRSAN